jgi:anti-sigma B factor antagonist
MTVTDPKTGWPEGSVPQFGVVVSVRADATGVVPHGELDLATAPELEAVLAAQTGYVIVDLRELSFVDASGLRVLLEADAQSRQDGKNLRFIAGEAVRRLFEWAGVPDQLTYVEAPTASGPSRNVRPVTAPGGADPARPQPARPGSCAGGTAGLRRRQAVVQDDAGR